MEIQPSRSPPTLADQVRALHEALAQGCPVGRQDRRTSPRRPCVSPLTLLPLGDGGQPEPEGLRDGVAVDISQGGLRVLCRLPPGSDAQVEVRLLVPGAGAHVLRCAVVRRRQLPSGYWELGLRFLEPRVGDGAIPGPEAPR